MPPAVVVYVHGLWMMGAEAALLRRRLQRDRGYRLQVFRYGSVHQPLATITAALSETIARIDAPEVHLLGHSLGGVVILQCLQSHPMAQPGRVLFMGTPLLGCRSAQTFGRWTPGRSLLGQVASEVLLEPRECRWEVPRELGIIAGTLPLGFGRLLCRFQEPNDGVVTVSETRLPGCKAHLSLPVSHMGLLLSGHAAREAGSFLQHGRFEE